MDKQKSTFSMHVKNSLNSTGLFFKDVFSWKGIKTQKWGWLTALFYGIGNVFWGIATKYQAVAQGVAYKSFKSPVLEKIAGGLWISIIREIFYMVFLLVLWGIKKPQALGKLRYTFTKGGFIMLLAVASNFLGNVSAVIGVVLLLSNTSLSAVLETSFIGFTFIASLVHFKQKFKWQTLVGVLGVFALMLGIFFLTYGGLKNVTSSAYIGMGLMFLANFGYMIKNMCAEYVFKNKLLDTEAVQLFATFYSAIVGSIIAPILLLILQPALEGGAVNAEPYKLIGTLITHNSGLMVVFVAIAGLFLLTGRNCQYAQTNVSGAALSNVFYQAKNLVTALFTVIAYGILSGVSGMYPYGSLDEKTGIVKSTTFDASITGGHYNDPLYWVLLVLLFFVIAYTCLSGQGRYEARQHEYRKERKIDDSKDVEAIVQKGKSKEVIKHEETHKNHKDSKMHDSKMHEKESMKEKPMAKKPMVKKATSTKKK